MKRDVAFLTVAVTVFICLLSGGLLHAAPKKPKKSATTDRALVAKEKNAPSGKRIALVIGNGAYRNTDGMPKLTNPANDADDMAAALDRFGFEVIKKKNLTKKEMDKSITEFGRRITNGDAALFYYAGHGLQVKGQNYLVPVDANIDSESEVPYETVNVNLLLDEMDNSKSKVNIVMLDACRNNPITGKFRSGSGRGLAPPTTMPKGTVIVYATDPGNIAADGDGRNGLFTSGLLKAFSGDDMTLGGVLTRASEEVEKASNQQQTPYINGPATVQKRFSFVSPSEMTDLKPSPVQPQPVAPTPVAQPAPRFEPPPPRRQADTSGIEMVDVPGGCFQMGYTFSGAPVYEVCLSDFSIGKYEVTQGQWKKVMGNNPSNFSSCGDSCPVENVSWNDVQEFIRKLNDQTGGSFRLPTEAEWEYAARSGGRSEKYSGGDNVDVVAWYNGNSGSKTHPVGQKQANGLGIYDISGNVWEWVSDWYGSYSGNRQQDPAGPSSGTHRVIRGGSWADDPRLVRSAFRFGRYPGVRIDILGFRLVLPSVR